ncbi:unnamed protein product [Polarella glacialis]|uniref:Anoctamin transmembrane domain-containing protein n=1 Tax=Polarella glacialis TaxID=89957 RepID=A0A813LP27_POLGL|nr:unnamed protein product [Polarella glacialis]
MADYFQVASVLPSYRAELRGSYSEFGWRALGWAVACLCLVETLVVVWYITFVRAQAFLHPDQRFTFLGIHAQTIESYGNILITANIKVMDPLLSAIITAINKRENWRTEQMSKDSKIKKLFIVKFIVNYYPQLYLAFIKEHVSGCIGGIDGCMQMFSNNLYVFFLTHFALEIIKVPIQMIYARYKIHKDIVRGEGSTSSTRYSYLEQQLNCPAYEGDESDFLDAIIMMGYVMLFAAVMPSMTVMAIGTNLVSLRLFGYRMLHVTQRANPNGREGIGAWDEVINFMSILSVPCNCALAVFNLHPLCEYSLPTKFALFICLEHVVFLTQTLANSIVPAKTTSQEVIEEENRKAADLILSHRSAVNIRHSSHSVHLDDSPGKPGKPVRAGTHDVNVPVEFYSDDKEA